MRCFTALVLGGLVFLLTVSCAGPMAPPKSQATHPIDHALGHTEVPLQPQRVVVMNPAVELDNLLALGITPVGVASFTGDRPFAISPYLAQQAEGIETVGNLVQPNLEKILQLKPDLIVIDESQQRLYPQLSKIAPTVALQAQPSRWQSRFLTLAEAVNRPEAAEQLLHDYERQVQAFKQALGDRLNQLEVSYIRVRTDGIFLYVKSSLVGQIMEELGIRRPPAQDVFLPDSPRIPLSLERLEQADGDVLIVFGIEFGDTEATFAQLQRHPLWQQLEAVKANQVHGVTAAYWSFPGIQGVRLLIHDLADYLRDARSL